MSLPYRLGSTAALPRRSVLGTASPLRVVAFNYTYSNPQPNQKRAKGNAAARFVRDMAKQQQRNVEEISMSKAQKESAQAEYDNGSMPMLPSAFVAAPLTQYPGGTDFLAYQFQRCKAWFTAKASLAASKVESMGKSWQRPRLQLGLGKIAPTGKVMYREVMEAFAAGDKTTIRRLCTPAYADKFIMGIEKRNPREQLHFEMKDRSSLLNPKLMSHVFTDGGMYEKDAKFEQAVVRLSSTQRLWKTNKQTGEVIPGSTKEQDRTEYVVMWRKWSGQTWKSSPWVLWGMTKTTTLEKLREELKFYQEQQARQAGWKVK